MNSELGFLINGVDIIKYVKSQWVACFGHILKIKDNRISKRK